MLKTTVHLLFQFYRALRLSVYPYRTCRFEPSCSEYTRQAIIKHGIFKGSFLGLIRISKCHPLHKGGYDPVK